MFTRRLAIVTVGLILSLISSISGVFAQATIVSSQSTITLGSVRYYDCAGEYIELHGDYHSIFHVVFDPSAQGAGTHLTFQHNSIGVTGQGLQTGIIYHAEVRERSGTTNIFAAPGFEMTTIDVFRLIAEGSAPDLWVEIREHITLAADGVITVRYTEMTSTCR
jgi:hypothetical protein